jgi:hypothetical protein
MANLPVAGPASLSAEPLYLPILPASRESELSLVNPTETVLKGRVTWFTDMGARRREQTYVVEARSSLQLAVTEEGGWIEIVPMSNAFAPEAVLTSVLRDGDRADLVSVSGQTAGAKSSIQVSDTDAGLSVHIINPFAKPTRVTFDSSRTISIAPLSALMISNGGLHKISSDSPIAVTMLRTQTANGKTHISSSYPRSVDGASVFPHFAIGDSFSTQFILSGTKDRHAVLRFLANDGNPLLVQLR